jgi:hypothetical protein
MITVAVVKYQHSDNPEYELQRQRWAMQLSGLSKEARIHDQLSTSIPCWLNWRSITHQIEFFALLEYL